MTSKLVAFATLGASTPSSGPALAAAIIGVLGIVSRVEGDWSETSLRDLALYAAWGATFTAIVVAGRLSPAARIDEHQAVQVFEGMFTLGLPVAVYGRRSRRAPRPARAGARPLLLLFVLGTVAALDSITMVALAHAGGASTVTDALSGILHKPVMLGVVNVNSPLRYDGPMLEGLLALAQHGQVPVLTPFIIVGANSPITLPAAIMQQNAEVLAGVTIVQLVNPGCPVVYGHFITPLDLRSGAVW